MCKVAILFASWTSTNEEIKINVFYNINIKGKQLTAH